MSLLRTIVKSRGSLQLVRQFSTERSYREISIPVPWGEIRGKWWGPTDIRPVLTIHGWQDNCGSFDRLIPLLNKNVGYLAVDLPGHGYSSYLPAGIYYHFTTYILTLKYISRYLQWPKVSLMGHSLGGIMCYIYTMLYPHNVDFTICLDGAKPMIRPNAISNMAKSIDTFLKNNERAMQVQEPPSYSIEELKQKVHAPNKGSVDLEFTSYLLERNVAPSKLNPAKFYFTRDPRLKAPDLLSFSQNELIENAQNITSPILIAKCKKGSYYEVKENFYEVLDVLRRSSKDCDFHYVEGTHHAHLNNPNEIAELINKFIQKHNVEERSIGSIKKEMVVTKK